MHTFNILLIQLTISISILVNIPTYLTDFVIRLKQFLQRINAKIHSKEANENVRRAFRNQAEKSVIITLISNSPDVVKNQLLTTSPNFHT